MIVKRLNKHYLDLLNKYNSNPNVFIYLIESGSQHILKVHFGANIFCLSVDDRSFRYKYTHNYFSKPGKYNTITGLSLDNLATKMKNEIARRVRVGG
jgi:hypothetical protein